MDITFYYAPMSSAEPVARALTGLQVPHKLVTFALPEGKQREPEYLRLNPNGKVPTLVVDGTPMFEALAIIQWLGERFGVERGLWPAADAPARLQAAAWSTWAYAECAPLVIRYFFATSPGAPAELHSAAWAEHSRSELAVRWQILDAKLADHPYLLGEQYTLVDVVCASVVQWAGMCGLSSGDYKHVQRWLAACTARPAFRPMAA